MALIFNTTSDFLLGIETNEHIEASQITRLLARNANNLSLEQKNRLIKILLDAK